MGENELPIKIRRIANLLATLLITLVVALTLASCGESSAPLEEQDNEPVQEAPTESEQAGEVHLSVDHTAIEGGTTFGVDVTLEQDDTALSVLERSGIPFESEDSSFGTYITSIEGITAGENGEASGWIFLINGESAQESADKYEVKDGDIIEWRYVTGE